MENGVFSLVHSLARYIWDCTRTVLNTTLLQLVVLCAYVFCVCVCVDKISPAWLKIDHRLIKPHHTHMYHKPKCDSIESDSGFSSFCTNVKHTLTCAILLIVSAHRLILGMASVVCVLVKTCVSSISLCNRIDIDEV